MYNGINFEHSLFSEAILSWLPSKAESSAWHSEVWPDLAPRATGNVRSTIILAPASGQTMQLSVHIVLATTASETQILAILGQGSQNCLRFTPDPKV